MCKVMLESEPSNYLFPFCTVDIKAGTITCKEMYQKDISSAFFCCSHCSLSVLNAKALMQKRKRKKERANVKTEREKKDERKGS